MAHRIDRPRLDDQPPPRVLRRVRLDDPDPPHVQQRPRLADAGPEPEQPQPIGQRGWLFPPLLAGLPRRRRGRQSAHAKELYDQHLQQFANRIKELLMRIGFALSSRGWGYALEGEGEIDKGELDDAQDRINDCRKSGVLPLDICAEDDRRQVEGLEELDDASVDDQVEGWVEALRDAPDTYAPISFWDDQPYYVETAVEKIDPKTLFRPVCAPFRIGIQNYSGWADINQRAGILRRFVKHKRAGRICVLLYCGDFDPGGLNISDWLRPNLMEVAGAVALKLGVEKSYVDTIIDELVIDRFGLNFEDIERLQLLWIDNLITGSGNDLASPTTKNGKRNTEHFKPYVQNYIAEFGARKCEANALVKKRDDGRELCRQAILKYVDADAPQRFEEKLAPHREQLRSALADRFDL